ncbi:MAG: hypothetical protein IJB71_02105 [Bacilli bacterium]|nr:hypothetical protein [Bacilli bacterium]
MKKLVLILTILFIITGCSDASEKKDASKPPKKDNQNETEEIVVPEEKEPMEVPEVYDCYSKEILKEIAKSEACVAKFGEKNCVEAKTRYNKNIIRFKGESSGVKEFNKTLEKVYDTYKLNNTLDGKVNYACEAATDKEILKGVNIDYFSEYLTLNQNYIIVRIIISHENLLKNVKENVLDKILIFDISVNREITIKELMDKLQKENNIKIKTCDTSKGDTCIYNNILSAVIG